MVSMNWRIWLLITEILFSLCGVTHGQNVVTRPVAVGTGVEKYTSGWHDLQPIRTAPDTGSKSANDIDSHMPAENIYRDPDPITSAHEQTHGINSYIRQQCGGRANAFYTLNNFVFIVREPNLRKGQVCAYVPTELRGDVWGLYMAGQQEWDDRPLYICDEWTAYINGAMVGKELGKVGNRSMEHDVRHCVEFAGYASALLVAIERHDPAYPDREKLQEFVAYNLKRTLKLTEPAVFAAQVEKFAACYAPGQPCQGNQCGTLQWQSNVWVRQRPILGGTKTIVTKPKLVVTTPAQPPLIPVTRPAVVSCQCSGEIASLKSQIAKLEAALASKSGCDCEPPKPTTVAFLDGSGRVYSSQTVPAGGTLKIPPNHVQNFSRDGKLIDEEKYPVGSPIRLRHGVPAKVK